MLGLFFNKKKLLTDRKALGHWGEKHAEKHLKNKGFKTLARNFLCNRGELDLVMADKDGTIVFVEVKTRTGEDFTLIENVLTKPKKESLWRAARYFLETNNITERPFRFDFVAIVLDQNAKETLKHYENAFIP